MKKSIIFFFVILLSHSIVFSQSIIFKAPDKIVKKTNFNTSYPIYNDTNGARVYFYFVDAIIDTIAVRVDSVMTITDIITCDFEQTAASIDAHKILNSGIYLLNDQGVLIYDKPIEEVYFGCSIFELSFFYDPICGIEIFGGYQMIESVSYRVSYTDERNCPPVDLDAYIHINKSNPFLVKIKGKWGLLNLDGSFSAEPIYDKIEWGERGVELYKDGVLDSIIEIDSLEK